MDMEASVRDAIVAELERQAETGEGRLKLRREADTLTVDGPIELEALAMAVVGAVAGGP